MGFQAARQYGELRAALERRGQPLGSLDMMIAAHALSLGLVLISSDAAFKRVKQLKVEDGGSSLWYLGRQRLRGFAGRMLISGQIVRDHL